MNKTFLDGKTLPEKMLELEQTVADFLKNVDPAAIAGITTQIQDIKTALAATASDAEFQLTKADVGTLTANLDALLKTVTALSGTKNRGHFATPAELAAVANPQVDEFAWVGQAGAWAAYVYEASGWTKTGGTSTHTTGYDPAEIVAIKTAATTLTARVTAVEAKATANTGAAAAAKAAADAAGVVAAKNTAAIAAIPVAGAGHTAGIPTIEMDIDKTFDEIVIEVQKNGFQFNDDFSTSPDNVVINLTKTPPGTPIAVRLALVHVSGTLAGEYTGDFKFYLLVPEDNQYLGDDLTPHHKYAFAFNIRANGFIVIMKHDIAKTSGSFNLSFSWDTYPSDPTDQGFATPADTIIKLVGVQ